MSTVLVPVDGTPFADSALSWAVVVARNTDAEILLCMVMDPLPLDALPPWKKVPETPHWLQSTAEGLRRRGVHVRTRVLTGGGVEESLIGLAAHEEIGLAVVATHGRGPVGRAFFGGVADRLARTAPWPVLAIPIRRDRRPPKAELRRIVVALNGSEWSEEALSQALPWVDRSRAELRLVQVIQTLDLTPPAFAFDAGGVNRSFLDARATDAEEYLGGLADRLRGEGWSVTIEAPFATDVAAGIVGVAARWEADLVLLATHGRSGVARAILGSVADHVLRTADRPVMIVRPAVIAGRRAPAAGPSRSRSL